MTLQVIFRSILVTTSLSLIHCAEIQKSTAQKTTHQSLTEKMQFESHPDWLALNQTLPDTSNSCKKSKPKET